MSNCSGTICCLGCLSLVPGVKRKVLNKTAFFPPDPPGYAEIDDTVHLLTHYETKKYSLLPDIAGIKFSAFKLECRSGDVVPAFYLIPSITKNSPKTVVLYAHGNSTDIGFMLPHAIEMCRVLNVEVFLFEYTGYGNTDNLSTTPNEKSIYENIEAAYDYLVTSVNKSPEDVVLYGQSIGSAPVVHLASYLADQGITVGGVILHSPIKSGLSVVEQNAPHNLWFDVFKNLTKIEHIKSSIFIIHGTNDQEVSIAHGIELYKHCLLPYEPWWVEGAGHNDIESLWKSEYFTQLRQFLSFCQNGL